MKIKYKELPLFCPFEIEGKQYIVSGGCAFDGEKMYHFDDETEVTAHDGVVEFYRNALTRAIVDFMKFERGEENADR